MNKREIGQYCENRVCLALQKRGYTIIKQNYFTEYGEIDIIAEKDDFICFIEVKARRKNPMVSGLEAVTYAKKKRIIKSAEVYLQESNCQLQPRYDICQVEFKENPLKVIEIDFYANAFDTTGINFSD